MAKVHTPIFLQMRQGELYSVKCLRSQCDFILEIPWEWQLSTNYQSIINRDMTKHISPTVIDGYTHSHTCRRVWKSALWQLASAFFELTLKINIWFRALVVCQLVVHFTNFWIIIYFPVFFMAQFLEFCHRFYCWWLLLLQRDIRLLIQ